MATSAGGGVGDVTSYKAAHDLSSNQYRFIQVTAANTVGSTGISGTTKCGILQNEPAVAGLGADVMFTGISKLVMGGTCSAGNRLESGTDGRGVIADSGTTSFCNAEALEAASAAGDIISVNQVAFINTSATA